MAANIIDPILATCVAGLIGAVGHLWRQNAKQGKMLNRLNRRLGKLKGLAVAVRACHIKTCPMQAAFANLPQDDDDEDDDEETG